MTSIVVAKCVSHLSTTNRSNSNVMHRSSMSAICMAQCAWKYACRDAAIPFGL